MLPLCHQEVLIMMLGGMEHVPSDISNDLNSCNGEQVHIRTHGQTSMHTQLCPNDASHNPLSFLC